MLIESGGSGEAQALNHGTAHAIGEAPALILVAGENAPGGGNVIARHPNLIAHTAVEESKENARLPSCPSSSGCRRGFPWFPASENPVKKSKTSLNGTPRVPLPSVATAAGNHTKQ
jgi:hypothetical protein